MLLLAATAALVAVPAVALGSASRHVGNSKTFADATGEDPTAPDITSVALSNDDAGKITFQVNVSNRPAFTQDMYFLIFLDTDRNAATGNPDFNGADYIVELDPGTIGLFRWNGNDYLPAASQTLTYAYAPTGATIRIAASELGKTKGFGFAVYAVSGATVDANGNPDFANVHRDAAPDPGRGLFDYQVRTKLVLGVTAFVSFPKPAEAGAAFAASLAVSENDTAGPVQKGTVACSATISSRRIVAGTRTVANGVASCIWRIPEAAKGKTIRGRVSLTTGGVTVSRSFSSTIH